MTADRFLFAYARTGGLPRPTFNQSGSLAHVVTQSEATLHSSGPTPATVLPNIGWIVGTVFRRNGPLAPVQQFDADELAELVATDGGSLITAFWGNYVAILRRPQGWTVLRAPLGIMPCYFVDDESQFACASDPGLLVDEARLRPQIQWKQVARTLYWTDLPATETALSGLCELLPGTSATFSVNGAVAIEQRWSPWTFVRSPTPSIEVIQRVVCNTAIALASPFHHPLLGLSGGLDSSILAVSLARRTGKLSTMTLSTRDGGGDERDYARLAATAAQAPSIEQWYQLEDVDLDRSVAQHQPRPVGWIHEQAYHLAAARAASDCGADVFVMGNGGDNAFYNSHSTRPVLDRLLAAGVGSALLRTINDVAEVTGTTWWEVVQNAWRTWRSAGRGYCWQRNERFLHPDLAEQLRRERQSHSWLETPDGALPSRSGHVAMLLRMQPHLDSLDRAGPLPLINPLAAQPIVELGLAIPSWEMVQGGRNRSVVRSAFARALPPQIIDRRGKGSPDGFTVSLFTKRARDIRDRLLGGQLAARGIIDRPALEATLRDPEHIDPLDRPRLLSLLDTESWLAFWQCR